MYKIYETMIYRNQRMRSLGVYASEKEKQIRQFLKLSQLSV